jgi:uncharacterized protein
MKEKIEKKKKKVRIVIRWIVWVVLLQFVLLNISAALYADKFTHLYTPEEKKADAAKPESENFLAKTWRLFHGYRFYKQPVIGTPDFAYTTIQLQTDDKIPVEAWYSKTDSLSKGTMILFHGLMGNKSLVLQQAEEFRFLGYNILLVDARAHGNSGSHMTTIGFRESEEVKLAYDYVLQQGEKTIFLWGFSMGAVEIIKAVSEHQLQPAGLILEMPYGSLQSHVKARMHSIGFPKQPFGFFVTFWIGVERGFNGLGFTLDKYAKKINCPVLLQYGSNDQLVSKQEVNSVYNAFASTHKRLAIYENVGHASLLQMDPMKWRGEVGNFLQKK